LTRNSREAPDITCRFTLSHCRKNAKMTAMRALSPRNLKLGKNAPAGRRNSPGARYEVLDRVGEGALWVVYRVRDRSTQEIFALKALKGNFNQHPGFLRSLKAATERTRSLAHSQVARVHEVGEEDNTLFVVTEWLPGQALEGRLRRAPFGRIEALSSTRQIAEALHYLHSNGAVHGDIRPRQIISAGDGTLKLTDTGLSEAFAAAGLSIADVCPEAVSYTAPERGAAAGRGEAPATPASDLYSLGVILYRMLSGRVPFDGPSAVSVAMRHRNDSPLLPSQFNPDCPTDLEQIALRLLAKNPADRYASAAALLQDLSVGGATVADSLQTAPAAQPAPIAQPAPVAVAAIANDTQPLPTPDSGTSTQPAAGAGTNASDSSNGTSHSTANGASGASGNSGAFPASLPISTIAATPISALTAAAVAPVVATPVVATPVVATPVVAAPVVAAPTVAAPTVATPVSTSPAAVAPVVSAAATTTPVAATPASKGKKAVAISPDDDERVARKKQRRREAIGAGLAFLWVVLAVGLLVGMVWGSYQYWISSAPKEVLVPSYVGKHQDQARTLLSKAGLQMTVVSEKYDPQRPAGTVIGGEVSVGKRVKAGRIVGVIVSRGAEQLTMPDLSELDLARVRQILAKAGMRLGNISEMYHDTIARGYICGQFPSPGTPFTRGEPINLIISRGPQPMSTSIAPSQLPPPPQPPDSGNASDPQSPLNAGDASTQSTSDSGVPLVSRTVLVRVPVPAKSGASTRAVRIVVRDADGEHTAYDQKHAPGELVDEYVQVTRPQGTTATIRIFIDNVLQKEQRV
jgi:serine/threonine-protein kinase